MLAACDRPGINTVTLCHDLHRQRQRPPGRRPRLVAVTTGESAGEGAGDLDVQSGGLVSALVQLGVVGPGPAGKQGAVDDVLLGGIEVFRDEDLVGEDRGEDGREPGDGSGDPWIGRPRPCPRFQLGLGCGVSTSGRRPEIGTAQGRAARSVRECVRSAMRGHTTSRGRGQGWCCSGLGGEDEYWWIIHIMR